MGLVVMGIEVIFKGHVLPHVSKGQIIMRGCLNYMSTMFEHGLQKHPVKALFMGWMTSKIYPTGESCSVGNCMKHFLGAPVNMFLPLSPWFYIYFSYHIYLKYYHQSISSSLIFLNSKLPLFSWNHFLFPYFLGK